jgi:carbamoyltransferase
MITLGITDGITSGAAIVDDGNIRAAVNEERLVRKKMAYGFPRCSIQTVLRLAGLEPRDIDKVAVATNYTYFCDEVTAWDGWFEARQDGSLRAQAFAAASSFGNLVGTVPGLEGLYHHVRRPIFAQRRKRVRALLKNEFDISAPVEFVDHHFAHVASAYWTSGFNDALVVSMDGGGDGLSATIYKASNGCFTKLTEVSSYNSLGNYYSYVTHISGFKAQKHEGKITGLAAHGTPRYVDILKGMIDLCDGEIVNVGRVVFLGAIEEMQRRLPRDFDIADLASSIQLHSEAIVVEYLRHWLRRSPHQAVALAGGLFANVLINQRVHQIDGVENVFVHPGMDDGGLAVGAALALHQGSPPERCMDDVYLGPDYTETQIAEALNQSQLPFSHEPSIEREIASLLAQGYVVARFNGKMEYGPRALGNRSILYQPTDPSVNDWLNKNLRRTEFMPFAPSTLYEYGDDCYRNLAGAADPARFMTITADCTDWMKAHCPGVVHLDGTARPQLVQKEHNPSYYGIIEEFRQLTGLNTVINTSFNVHEEPIVCSPEDAIRAFLDSNLDYLAIGSCLVKNPKPLSHALRPVQPVGVPLRVD